MEWNERKEKINQVIYAVVVVVVVVEGSLVVCDQHERAGQLGCSWCFDSIRFDSIPSLFIVVV